MILTEDEITILQMFADGLIQKEVAVKKNLGFETLSRRLLIIRAKIGAKTTVNAVVKAMREGVVK